MTESTPQTEQPLSPEQVDTLSERLTRLLSDLTFGEPTRGNRYVESVDGNSYFEEYADIEYDAYDLLRRCPALCRTLRVAWQWKAEALPILTRYDNLAESFGGKLGSSKVANLEQGVAALRAHLAEAIRCRDLYVSLKQGQEARANEAEKLALQLLETGNELQSQLAQVTSERDEAIEILSPDAPRDLCDAARHVRFNLAVNKSSAEKYRVENEKLRKHIADLNHDLNATVEFCDKEHGHGL